MSAATTSLELPRMPSFRLDGRRALITGAGRGIWVALAAAMVEVGAEAVLVSRTGKEVEALAKALAKRGGKAAALALDVTDHAKVRQTLDDMAPFDILICNAGTNRPKPLIDVTEEDYAVVVDLNLKAAFFTAQAVVRRMIQTRIEGSVIFVSSQMGHVGAANRSIYCASKHAIEGLTKAMAVELGRHRIRVNAIAPTFIETPMTRPYLEEDSFRKQVLDNIKLGRLGRIEDLMGAVVYLAGDASSLVTGTSLRIDGGWTAA